MRGKGTRTSKFGTSKRESHDASDFYNRRIYKEIDPSQKPARRVSENMFPEQLTNQVICASSRSMEKIPNDSVHLMVTSPPYNVGKEYDENLTMDEYNDLIFDVLNETYRALVPGGRMCINVANIGRKPYLPIHKQIMDIALKIGFLMRGEVIWNKSAGAGTSTAWGSWKSASNPSLRDVHEYILVYSKDKFDRSGKNKSNTISNSEFLEYTKSVWDFMPESAKKVGHPAPFPVELPYRCIQLYSFVDDVVLDPFCGVGTTCVAAKMTGRRYIGFDSNANYIARAKERLSKIVGIQTTLKLKDHPESQ